MARLKLTFVESSRSSRFVQIITTKASIYTYRRRRVHRSCFANDYKEREREERDGVETNGREIENAASQRRRPTSWLSAAGIFIAGDYEFLKAVPTRIQLPWDKDGAQAAPFISIICHFFIFVVNSKLKLRYLTFDQSRRVIVILKRFRGHIENMDIFSSLLLWIILYYSLIINLSLYDASLFGEKKKKCKFCQKFIAQWIIIKSINHNCFCWYLKTSSNKHYFMIISTKITVITCHLCNFTYTLFRRINVC